MIKNLATIENVSLGHPDRQTELIGDKILDKLLAIDNKAKVAIEITGTGNNIAIGGEVNLHGHKVDLDVILAEAVSEVMEFAELTEFAKTVNIINIVKEQSPDIANLVEEDDGTVNAGDQGHMIGYALNAPEYNYLPEAYFLTTSILKLRDDIWHKKDTQLGKWLRGDAKTQMTWSPQTGKIHSIVVSTQHTEDADLPKLRELIRDEVLKPVLGDKWHDEIVLYINYAGQFVLGGIEADSSAVGRKLAITTAMGAVGGYLKNKDFEDENNIATLPFIAMSGGASSGKDPSKVDRTGHLMARYIAKNIVSQLGVEEAFVQLSYVIGFNQPTSLYIQGKGLTQKQNNALARQVCEQIDLSPSGIIERFNLDQPIYFETTKNGQFDDPTRPWEQLDLTFTLS